MIEIFQAQFPQASSNASFAGRVQAPLKNLDEKTMNAAVTGMLEHCPPWITEEDVEGQDRQHFKKLSLYGFLPSMTYIGSEYQALGSVRYGFRGSRTVLLARIAQLWKHVPTQMMQDKASQWSDKYTLMNFLNEVLSCDNEVMKGLLKQQNLFQLASVGEGDVLYAPAGVMLIEKVTGGQPCVGLRMSLSDARSKVAIDNLECIVNAYEKFMPSAGDSNLVKLWKDTLAIATTQ